MEKSEKIWLPIDDEDTTEERPQENRSKNDDDELGTASKESPQQEEQMWSEFVFDVNDEIELTSSETMLCQKILDKWATDVDEGKKVIDGWKTDVNLLTKDQRVYMVFKPDDWKKIKSTATSDINTAIALAISKVLYIGKSSKESNRTENHSKETMDFDRFSMQEAAAGRRLVYVYFIPEGLENAYGAIESILIQELKAMSPDFCPQLLNKSLGNIQIVGKVIKNYDQTKRSQAVMYLFFLMLTKSNAYSK